MMIMIAQMLVKITCTNMEGKWWWNDKLLTLRWMTLIIPHPPSCNDRLMIVRGAGSGFVIDIHSLSTQRHHHEHQSTAQMLSVVVPQHNYLVLCFIISSDWISSIWLALGGGRDWLTTLASCITCNDGSCCWARIRAAATIWYRWIGEWIATAKSHIPEVFGYLQISTQVC